MNKERHHEHQYFGEERGERQAFAPLEHEAIRKESARKGAGQNQIYELSPEYTKSAPIFFQNGDNDNVLQARHEIVDASIVIYGLSGILCEKEMDQPKPSKKIFGKSKSKHLSSATFQTRSSSSSLEDRGVFVESASNPICALISITSSYGGNNMDCETFLPSIPLHCPSVNGLTARYTALWPAFMDGEPGKDRSSFNIVRTMQESQDENQRLHLDSKYVPETVELHLSLSMGAEMIQLGATSIVISGEEEVEVKMNVPARGFEQNQKGKHKKKSKSKRSNKDGYFSNDLTKRYFLEDNATLRIGIQVLTEKIKKKQAKEQKRKEIVEHRNRELELAKKQQEYDANRVKELRARMERVTMENTKRRLRMKRQIYYSNYDDDLFDQAVQRRGTRHAPLASNFMCAMPNMLCADDGTIENRGTSYMSTGSVTLTDDGGLESTISSVSNSMYGSEMGSDSFTDNGTYFTDYD